MAGLHLASITSLLLLNQLCRQSSDWKLSRSRFQILSLRWLSKALCRGIAWTVLRALLLLRYPLIPDTVDLLLPKLLNAIFAEYRRPKCRSVDVFLITRGEWVSSVTYEAPCFIQHGSHNHLHEPIHRPFYHLDDLPLSRRTVKANCMSHYIAGGDPSCCSIGEGIFAVPDHDRFLDYAAGFYEPEDVIDGGFEG